MSNYWLDRGNVIATIAVELRYDFHTDQFYVRCAGGEWVLVVDGDTPQISK